MPPSARPAKDNSNTQTRLGGGVDSLYTIVNICTTPYTLTNLIYVYPPFLIASIQAEWCSETPCDRDADWTKHKAKHGRYTSYPTLQVHGTANRDEVLRVLKVCMVENIAHRRFSIAGQARTERSLYTICYCYPDEVAGYWLCSSAGSETDICRRLEMQMTCSV